HSALIYRLRHIIRCQFFQSGRHMKGIGITVIILCFEDQTMTSSLQQKLRITGPVVITANRLSDGIVVHRTHVGAWSDDLSRAEALADAEASKLGLKAARADGLTAVGAYLAPVAHQKIGLKPGNLREMIRVKGPSFALPSDSALVAKLHNKGHNGSGIS